MTQRWRRNQTDDAKPPRAQKQNKTTVNAKTPKPTQKVRNYSAKRRLIPLPEAPDTKGEPPQARGTMYHVFISSFSFPYIATMRLSLRLIK